MSQEKENNKPVIPAEIYNRFETYKAWQLFWFVLHYVVGVGAVVAGGLAGVSASDSTDIPTWLHECAWLFGLLSGFFGSIVTFLRPLKIAETYKQAYYKLSSAIIRFEVDNISMNQLLDEFESTQQIILQKDKDAIQHEAIIREKIQSRKNQQKPNEQNDK